MARTSVNVSLQLLRLLQYFDAPEGVDGNRLGDVLNKIFKETQMHVRYQSALSVGYS